ncbi:hypothetical protein [Streptomyces yanii]|uniref:Uncharacterized protein n=1 Tax=Streptomyces yanii TaxID=78510 RepID=A0ABV5RNC2_9ACTN
MEEPGSRPGFAGPRSGGIGASFFTELPAPEADFASARPLPVHPAPATASPGAGERHLDRKLEVPAGASEAARPIRDEIRAPVEALIVEIVPQDRPP